MEVLILSIILLLLLGLTCAGFSLAPWLPTWGKDLDRIGPLAHLKKGERFLEIGCGDGRVSRFIAKEYPDVLVTGIELSFLMWSIAKLRTLFFPQKNLKIVFGNALKLDFSKYDVIYFYGLTETFEKKVKPKLESELRPGARFMSYAFQIENWNGEVVVDKPTKHEVSIIVYKK